MKRKADPKNPAVTVTAEEFFRWKKKWAKTCIGFSVTMFHGTGSARKQIENGTEYRWWAKNSVDAAVGRIKAIPVFANDEDLFKWMSEDSQRGWRIRDRMAGMVERKQKAAELDAKLKAKR
jgi:hypothetical protein